MATPVKRVKLYPTLPASPTLGVKRKGKARITDEKENVHKHEVGMKKQKLISDSPLLTSLQDAIDRECKMRDAASKLLQLSKSTQHNMEASKGLFVSNMKILELMKELQHTQRDTGKGVCIDNTEEELKPCQARIGISNIRIPLEWKEFEQIKGKLDPSHKIGVFCLFRLGSQVMDTQTLAIIDRNSMDIAFPGVIVFPKRVDPDFTLIVEVYSSVPSEPHPPPSSSSSSGKESTPMKVLRKLKKDLSLDHLGNSPISTSSSSSALSLSPYIPAMTNVNPSHGFALAGHTKFTLKDVMGTCCTYILTRGAVGSSGTAASSSVGDQPLLPLWGQICCNIMAEPTCSTQPRSTGFIHLQQMISGYPAWTRLWCVLRQHHLRCWTYPEDVGRQLPVKTVDLTKEMTVENAPRLTMRRPNTLLIKDHETDSEFFVSFESKEEREKWTTVLRQAIVDLKVWKESSNYIIQKQSSKFYNENDFDGISGYSPYKRNNPLSQYKHTAETTVL